MSKPASQDLGTKPIGELIVSQSVPAGIGILVMSLNMLVDTIFVGNWIGAVAIAAITIVLPITFFIASFGMAVGIGGSSIISRAFGANNPKKAQRVFNNQIILSFGLSSILVVIGLIFRNQALALFGAKGDVILPASQYYTVLLIGLPFLTLAMTGSPVIRAEGKPVFSMVAMILPAIVNIVLDYVLIFRYDMGMIGAGWATTFSYSISFAFIFWYFLSKNSELKISLKGMVLEWSIVKEISSLGLVTLSRQGVVSILAIILNNTLYKFGGTMSIAVYGIIGRLLMFCLFPILGIAQGFMPIVGYNYGAKKFDRVMETIKKSISYGTGLAILVFILILVFPQAITRAFTKDAEVLSQAPDAIRMVFLVTPLIAIQLIGSAYFQAVGKAKMALFLTLSKQGFFLIPLLLILPNYYGLLGVWIAFPISDFSSTALTAYFLNKERKHIQDQMDS